MYKFRLCIKVWLCIKRMLQTFEAHGCEVQVGGVERELAYLYVLLDRKVTTNHHCHQLMVIHLLEYPISPPPAHPSQKPSYCDISGTKRGIIDSLVSKQPEKFLNKIWKSVSQLSNSGVSWVFKGREEHNFDKLALDTCGTKIVTKGILSLFPPVSGKSDFWSAIGQNYQIMNHHPSSCYDDLNLLSSGKHQTTEAIDGARQKIWSWILPHQDWTHIVLTCKVQHSSHQDLTHLILTWQIILGRFNTNILVSLRW